MQRGNYISIIILAHNRYEVTERCLRSIIEKTWETPFELVLVFNGGDEGNKDIINLFEHMRDIEYNYKNVLRSNLYANTEIIINEQNLGLQPGRNQGMEAATGKWMMWLDNDAWITNDYTRIPLRPNDWTWKTDTLGRFVYWMKEHRKKTGEITVIGQTGGYWGPDRVSGRVQSGGFMVEVDEVMGYNVAFDSEVYDVGGPIDNFYGVRGRQDTEFCFNAKYHGFKVYRTGYIGIDHVSGNVHGSRFAEKFHENSRYLVAKWNKPERLKRLNLVPRSKWVRD